MRNIVYFLVLLSLPLCFFSCLTPDQAMVSQYGHINRVKTKNGATVKTGLWVEPADSSNVQMAIYVDGLKQGLVRTVFRSGGYVITHYKDDVKDGKSTTYWNDGKVYRVETYVSGKLVQAVNVYPADK